MNFLVIRYFQPPWECLAWRMGTRQVWRGLGAENAASYWGPAPEI